MTTTRSAGRNDGQVHPICYAEEEYRRPHPVGEICYTAAYDAQPRTLERTLDWENSGTVVDLYGGIANLTDLQAAQHYATLARIAEQDAATYAREAHASGATWQQIADATGLNSRQAAQQRYGH